MHLAQVAPNLENLRINEQPVVTKYDQHAYQIARIAHLEASVGLAVSAMSDSHYGLDLDGGRLASHLTDEQRNAVLSSVQSKLSIIVGGPGTGKTSIIVELLRVVYELGLQPERMVLAAPTGKAAYRMGESVSNALQRHQDPSQRALQERLSAPMTLHRLLDYRPWSGQFGRHRESPIPADVVIIDEASMVDLELFLHIIDG